MDVSKILSKIDERIESIDIYIYIFWRVTTSMYGVIDKDISFMEYIEREFEKIKKLNIESIIKKISSNTDFIAYIFKANLTPSGYIYNAPTPEMKGRLLKQYS
jgi:hypothetical protein